MRPRLDQMRIASEILPLDHPELPGLMRRRGGRVLLDAGRCYALIVLAVALLAWRVTPLTALVSFVLIGTQQHALFILAHDGMHSSLLARRRSNDAFTTLLLFAPILMCLGDQKTTHLDHHRWLSSDQDPDRFLHRASNKATPALFLFFLTGLLTIIPSFVRVSPFAEAKHSPLQRLAEFFRRRVAMLFTQALLFALFWSLIGWWAYPIFWVLPIYVLVAVPNQVRAFCEHAQPVLPDEAADPHRLVTFRSHRLERVFFAPMNMNFHAEHHLWQFVPYYNLPRLRPLIVSRPEIEVRASYLGFLWRYFRRLPLTPAAPPEPA